jgi:aspartyl-tRNA(Asn)/glutamyl-tRNA(Gln) amidotransferase subunit A
MAACFGGVDALLTPAAPGPAPDAATTGDPVFNSPWSYTGLPTVCFPAGRSAEGLPLAVQLVGRAWDEGRLLAAAAWCERQAGVDMGEPPAG